MNVPTNAEIKLLVAGWGAGLIELENERGAVPTRIDRHENSLVVYVRVRPNEPLSAGATHRLVVDGVPVATFTTGLDRDDRPPQFEGVRSIEGVKSNRPFWEPESSCADPFGFDLDISPGADDQSPESDIWYHVYAASSPEDLDLSRPTTAVRGGVSFLGTRACGTTLDLGEDRNRVVVLAAVDLAGNESVRTEPLVLIPTRGCSSAAGGGGASALLLLTGLLRRRRQR